MRAGELAVGGDVEVVALDLDPLARRVHDLLHQLLGAGPESEDVDEAAQSPEIGVRHDHVELGRRSGRRRGSARCRRRRSSRCRSRPGPRAGVAAGPGRRRGTRTRMKSGRRAASSAPATYPKRPRRDFHFFASRLAWAPTPRWTLLTTTVLSSSTMRSTRRVAPTRITSAASAGSSGRSTPRAKSLPVPSGTRPRRVLPSSSRCHRALTTACRLPSPPATTTLRPRQVGEDVVELLGAPRSRRRRPWPHAAAPRGQRRPRPARCCRLLRW